MIEEKEEETEEKEEQMRLRERKGEHYRVGKKEEEEGQTGDKKMGDATQYEDRGKGVKGVAGLWVRLL